MLQNHFYKYYTTIATSSSSLSPWYPLIRKAIALNDLSFGKCVHAAVIKHGHTATDRFLMNNLINMYSKCGSINSARKLFSVMPHRDLVTWNSMLAGYAFCCDACLGGIEEGLYLFKLMLRCSNVYLTKLTFAAVLKLCLKSGYVWSSECLHGFATKIGLESEMLVSGALVNIYIKFGKVNEARKVFDCVKENDRDKVLWNMMLRAYVKAGRQDEAFRFFSDFHRSEVVRPNVDSLKSVLGGFAKNADANTTLGEQVHGMIMKLGFEISINVSNTIINMYSKMGCLTRAERVFSDLEKKDVVTWNLIISSYVKNGLVQESVDRFIDMLRDGIKPDEITAATVAKACAFLASSKLGRQIHGYGIKLGVDEDLYVSSSLVDMYAKCGDMEDAHKAFEEIPFPDEVSWTSMISGCVENGDENYALAIYQKIRRSGMYPDEFTFATLVKACSSSTALEQGRQIHADAIKCNADLDTYVSTSLVDFYAKCGNIEESFQVFKTTHVRDIALWNAMLSGFAHHGSGKEALELFNDFKCNSNLLPDRVTFISILSACSHSGLISEAYKYLESMIEDYGIEPDLEHYSYMVDALSRAGRLLEAEKVVTSLPLEASGLMYRILLGACRFQECAEILNRLATKLLKLRPFESSTYVLLSSVYAAFRQWSEVADARKTMKRKNVKKDPGFSWIYVRNKAHVFFVDDRSHPQHDKMEDLVKLIKEDGCIYDTNHMLLGT